MTREDQTERLEGAERIGNDRVERVITAVENIDGSFDAMFPSEATDPIADQVASMQPSGPTEAATDDMPGLRSRIELLTRKDAA